MWKLFEELPVHGHKATEFVDLLGYHTVKNPYLGETDWRTIIISVIDMLKAQNHVTNSHPNARIYQQLADITGLEGYYLGKSREVVDPNPTPKKYCEETTGPLKDDRRCQNPHQRCARWNHQYMKTRFQKSFNACSKASAYSYVHTGRLLNI